MTQRNKSVDFFLKENTFHHGARWLQVFQNILLFQLSFDYYKYVAMKVTAFSMAKFEITNFDIQLIREVFHWKTNAVYNFTRKKLAHLYDVRKWEKIIIFDTTAVVSRLFYLI